MNREEKYNLIRKEDPDDLCFVFTSQVHSNPTKFDYYYAIVGNDDIGFMPYPLYLDMFDIFGKMKLPFAGTAFDDEAKYHYKDDISVKHFDIMNDIFNTVILDVLPEENIMCEIKINNGCTGAVYCLQYSNGVQLSKTLFDTCEHVNNCLDDNPCDYCPGSINGNY